MNAQIERINNYIQTFNVKQDYVECHHISREMLLDGDDRSIAKALATLSALMEQAQKKKWAGYKKLHKKFLEQLDEIERFPFDEEDLRLQLQLVDEQVENEPQDSIIPIQLRK
ncbi:hypothetical protein ACSVDE_12585 [Pseudalkalibacillus sp. Hm43]|uniref:hypothetical protein n=1 Tax=Pseudalkalibacillus sp. Hm43 TaxID=3450742 RepID=UPI003F443F6F